MLINFEEITPGYKKIVNKDKYVYDNQQRELFRLMMTIIMTSSVRVLNTLSPCVIKFYSKSLILDSY